MSKLHAALATGLLLVACRTKSEPGAPDGARPTPSATVARGTLENPLHPRETAVPLDEQGHAIPMLVYSDRGRLWLEVLPAAAREFLWAWGIDSKFWGFIPESSVLELEAALPDVLASDLGADGRAIAARLAEYRRQYAQYIDETDGGSVEHLVGCFFLDPSGTWTRSPERLGSDARSWLVDWDIRRRRVLRVRIGGHDRWSEITARSGAEH